VRRAKKVSVSIQPDLLAAITRRAKRLYGGNISAVIAEMGEDVKRLEAMDTYFETYRVVPRPTRLALESRPSSPAPTSRRAHG